MLKYCKLDRAYQALGDSTRMAIIERLAKGPAAVSELAREQPMSLAAVMQHLKVLEAAGLVKSEKVGRTRICRVDPLVLSEAERWITERRQMWERNLDRLGAYLGE
jgi:DNA-binding transcriptional ArsR family regulator